MTSFNKLGKQSIVFPNPVSITSFASIVGPKEKQGPLGDYFNNVLEDNYNYEKTWEITEHKMLRHSLEIALQQKGYLPSDLDYFLAGDLLNQIIASSFAARGLAVPYIGLYGACSTIVEGILLGAVLLTGSFGKKIGVGTCSHHDALERQLRFPTELGVQRPLTSQWTVTGSGSFILENTQDKSMITQGIFGKIIDMGISNAMDMGSAMAPAAAATIDQFLKDTQRTPQDIDLIVTGDLGNIGRNLCKDLLSEKGWDIADNYTDCGILIYDPSQDVHAGGSGAGCCSSVLAAYLLPQLLEGRWNNMFVVATGALLSPTSTQQGETIPCIAHGVLIEKR